MKARNNPFSAQRIDRIPYRPVTTGFDELLSKLGRMNYRAAITGPAGSGKTTLLAHLKISLSQKGFTPKSIFVNDTRPFTNEIRQEFLIKLKAGDMVFLDGADHLSFGVWQRFKEDVLNSAKGLLITSHKRGLLPTLIGCSTTQELFADVVSGLLPQNCRIDQTLLNQIYSQHRGNICNCLRQLYDFYAAGYISGCNSSNSQ